MKVCWWLIRAMFKSANWNQMNGGILRKRGNRIQFGKLPQLGQVLIGLCVFLYIAYFLGYRTAVSLVPAVEQGVSLSQVSQVPAMLSIGLSGVVTLTSALMFLLQGDDLPQFFLLPVSRFQIVLARSLLLIGVSSFWIPIMMFLPFGFSLAWMTGQSLGVYLVMAYLSLWMSVIPACVVAIVLVLFARCFSCMLDKDKMLHISNAVALLMMMAFGIVYGVLSSSRERGFSFNGEGSQTLLFKLFRPLDAPSAPSSLLTLLVFTLLSILCFAILVFVLQKWLLRMTSGSKSVGHREVKKQAWTDLQFSRGTFKTLLRREWRRTSRSPSFMMGVVMVPFLYPVLILIGLVIFFVVGMRQFEGGFTALRAGINLAVSQFESSPLFGFSLIGLIGILFLMAGQAGMANASLTREGAEAVQLKLLPVSPRQVFAVKLAFGFLLELPGLILIYVVAPIVFGVPLKWCIHIILISVLVHILLSLWEHGFDWCFPRLHWTNEVYAAKQNWNTLFVWVGSMLIGGVLCALLYLGMILDVPFWGLLGFTYAVLLALLLGTVLLTPLLIRRGWRKIA